MAMAIFLHFYWHTECSDSQGDFMTPPIEAEGTQRNTVLRNLLMHLREKELGEIQRLRRDQAGDAPTETRDSMDDARGDEDLEVHADLIGRAEDRLAEIHRALERLDANTYGICAKCKGEIDLARIRAVPFTELCVDCQRKLDAKSAGRRGEIGGTTGDEFMAHWTTPEGIVERLGDEEPLEAPEQVPPELTGQRIVPGPVVMNRPVKQKRTPKSTIKRGAHKKSR
jgi:DnaK suppressor protein